MMRELGYCSGIENYSRHLDGRPPGSTPYTLLDYFPDDYLTFIDESHITLPQVRGMYNGDRSRKTTLVEYGFRLPGALDNRPLQFEEFLLKTNQLIFVSATPGPYELENSGQIVEQIIRPTGLVDPEVEVRPTKNQIDDLLNEVAVRVEHGERVLITTLTMRMAEDLTDYLLEHGVKARYMHANIETLDRIQIIRGLRIGEFDVLVGINLLREGLDLPEVTLVAILDADKEGFLRGERALIQTIGRAARNVKRAGDHVRRQGDRLDARRHRGDEPPARDPERLQRAQRHRAAHDHQGCLRHPHRRRGEGPLQDPAPEGRSRRARRSRRAADPHSGPRGRDARGGRGAKVRVRCQAEGRDQGTGTPASGGGLLGVPEKRMENRCFSLGDLTSLRLREGMTELSGDLDVAPNGCFVLS